MTMYKTKKELDLHVEDTFSKVRGEHEKAMRCFTIAKQYASIKEFNSAIRYMEKYLTTNPSNTGEALKLIGDYYHETHSFEKALEFYKSSYKARKTRESLTKICDLLEAGHGGKEDQGMGRQKWFDLQRVAPNLSDSPMSYQHEPSPASFTNRPSLSSGPPRTGFSKTLMTSSNISMHSPKSNPHVNGISPHEVSFSLSPKAFTSPEREETHVRSLERRYDDTLAKILGTVQRIENEMNLLKGKVEGINLMQEKLAESQRTEEAKSKSLNGNPDGENIDTGPPIAQPQQLPPMQPNPYGYGVPFPSPYMNPFFMPDPALSFLNNPMLAAAALYGNPMFGNPLAAGAMPRNEVQQPTIPPNPTETSVLAGLLSKNQFMPPPAASTQIGDGLYPQNQLLQAQLASSANLSDKLWQAPQLVPTSVALGPMFSAAGTSTSNANTSGIMNSFENNKSSPLMSTPLKTPTNSTATKAEINETPKSASSSVPNAKKEVKGVNLFPENVVVSNTEKVPTVSSSAFNSNVLSVTIPPEHRNAGTANNNTSSLPNFNTSMTKSESKTIKPNHNFQISAPVFKPHEPKFDEKKKDEAATPFSNISFTAPSFGDLAKSAASTGFTGFQSVNAFSGTGTPVFGNVIASQSAAGDAVVRQDRVDGDEPTDEFVPTAEFQPVIPLPPLVEVKKGNENENTLFEHRAKIYRFVKETKEWKERGVGNIMILQDKDNPRKIRVVMWRERVFKLACNHWITKDLVIENHQGSAKVVKWTVMDFAEGDSDPKLEIFTCRFAQEDKCAEFKDTMERMIAYLSTQDISSPEQKPREKEVPFKPFADIFKKPAGSWSCTACYVNNAEKDIKCVSCDTPKEVKPSKEPENSLPELFRAPEGNWNFGGNSLNIAKNQTVPNSAFNSNALSATITPEHKTAGTANNNTSVFTITTQEPKFDEKKKEDAANSFSNISMMAPSLKFDEKKKEDAANSFSNISMMAPSLKFDEKKKEDAANPFSNISLAAPSFGDLAKSAASTGFTGFQSVNAFSGTGTPVFGNVIASQSPAGDAVVRQDRTDGDEATEEFVPTAEFQPVIPLPPLVEVKKGNENENTLFEHRAKIYRFVKETKEWKERGVGNITILQDKDNPRKIRVVMWRERVFKLACNHWITKDLVIENHQGSGKVVKWTVMDFAEGDNDPKLEIFTCRFAQEDKCAEFKDTMERMIAYLSTEDDSSPPEQKSQEKDVPVKPFADIFKKPAGSWSCTACYVNNAEKDIKCVSCDTPKEVKLCMGTEKSLAELFKAPEGSWSCVGCYCNNAKDVNLCVACKTPKPGYQPQPDSTLFKPEVPFTFGFGALASNNVPNKESPSQDAKNQTVSSSPFNSNALSATISPEHQNAAPVFKPQEPKSDEKKEEEAANPFSNISLTAPSFGDLAKSAASTGFTGFQGVNAFSGTGAPVFGNLIASQSAVGDALDRQDRADGDEPTEEFVPTAEFQPVIPLPPLVEVKKGNENENTLFEHRAKIYRFVKETKEWKERGVGNITILQDKDNPRKIRVVMWRERVFKLACNHWITKDLVIENHQGSAKVVKWTVMDFAEGDSDPKLEIFTCRFAQEDKCAEFKDTMQRMIAYLSTQDDSSPEQKSQEKEVIVKPFADIFNKPAGSWTCTACYVTNAEKDIKCVSCDAPKEVELYEEPEKSLAEKSLADIFKSPEGSWGCLGCYLNNGKDDNVCIACNAPKPGYQPQPDSTLVEPETVPFTFGLSASEPNVPHKESPSHENGEKCRGCDPDSFDFSLLDNRILPLEPKAPIQKISKTLEETDEQSPSTN